MITASPSAVACVAIARGGGGDANQHVTASSQHALCQQFDFLVKGLGCDAGAACVEGVKHDLCHEAQQQAGSNTQSGKSHV